VQLRVGALKETVTVTAETPLVDLTSKEIGGNVTNREVTPSVTGSFVGMVALLPDVISNISTESFGSEPSASAASTHAITTSCWTAPITTTT
jgi:hypothetical protein